MHSRKDIYSTTTSPTLSLISGTPSAAFSTIATPTNIENVGVYLAIAISIYINIVYK